MGQTPDPAVRPSIRRSGIWIFAGALLLAAALLVWFFVIRSSGAEEYDGVRELAAAVRDEGFRCNVSVNDPPVVGETGFCILKNPREGADWTSANTALVVDDPSGIEEVRDDAEVNPTEGDGSAHVFGPN